jgi:predicted molibdopterin-dependent oxidoreductase YjgC
MKDVLTTCCYCGCGCGMYIHVAEGRIVGVSPSRSHPVSRNNLCVKGWHIDEFIYDRNRLRQPLIRRDGRLTPASWNEALALTASRLTAIRDQHGGASLGVLASAKCTNEENYLIQKVARAVLKTNNVDHCARL